MDPEKRIKVIRITVSYLHLFDERRQSGAHFFIGDYEFG